MTLEFGTKPSDPEKLRGLPRGRRASARAAIGVKPKRALGRGGHPAKY
ncbi:hypothetical protein OIE66_00820 [Nonomuraea sp. NBC_01738]|nr:hypothetical protein OIE66_00820 [Nonomuraea sp. NBC_01738]